MTTCYSNTLVHLECYRQDYLLSSMATVVDLNKGNTSPASLFVWCMSGSPQAFQDKMCTCDKLLCMVLHVWLTVNLTCAHDEFAHVVHL